MKSKLILCPMLVWSILLASCVHTPHMTRTSVIQVANHAAETEGFNLEHFERPDASFESDYNEHMWTVFYTRRDVPPNGNHFDVVVDDRTGKTFILKGPLQEDRDMTNDMPHQQKP